MEDLLHKLAKRKRTHPHQGTGSRLM